MELKLDTKYLKELLDYESSSLVGKVLKRFEILDNKELLKSDIREVIYEEFRHLRDLLIAGGRGLEQSVFKFNKEGK